MTPNDDCELGIADCGLRIPLRPSVPSSLPPFLSPSCLSPPSSLGSIVYKAPARLAMFMVAAYQVLVRPFLFGTCRYCPTCSEYAIQALATHGLLRGAGIAAIRLVKCHPLSPGGYDPVPPGN
ncbi:MAG: membrane protein insertion efficiency factor YidD [Phycisphaerae bacterium]